MIVSNPIRKNIESMVNKNDVLLFMKGTPERPLCGFSSAVLQILNYFNLDFHAINVLDDDELRQEIKDFSQWPTIPQLYIKGEFIGGCDILRDMMASGEFFELLIKKGINVDAE